MSTTELAIQAKGKPEFMVELWETVYRLVALWAYKYTLYGYKQGTRIYEKDDLMQAAYLALAEATESFDPTRGAEFTTHLYFFIRSHFAECAGHHGTKIRPETYAASLDETVGEEYKASHHDLLTDKTAEWAFEDAFEAIANQEVCQALFTEIECLPPKQKQAVILNIWEDQPLKETAAAMDLEIKHVRQCREKGLRKLRKTRTVQLLRKDYCTAYRHVSFSEFQSTWTSTTEAAVLQLEQ